MEDLRNFHWGLNTRFTLEIGLTNPTGKIMKKQRGAKFDPNTQYYLKVGDEYQPLIPCTQAMFKKYHDLNLLYVEIEQNPYGEPIIWFSQGVYICTSFNSTINANSYSVSVSGKDKMCQLNGEMGGNLTASIDFGQIETIETSYIPIELTAETYKYNTYYIKQISSDQTENYTLSSHPFSSTLIYYEKQEMMIKEKIPIAQIIKNLLTVYAEELETNIIIRDLEEAGVELLQYRGDEPMYMFYDIYGQTVVNQIVGKSANQLKFSLWENNSIKYTCADIPIYENLIEQTKEIPTYISYGNPAKKCSVIKLEKGQAAGYRLTQLVYAGDLIANQGETITSVLDKIKNMLGDFEYFYDEEGRFIFQRKRTYANVSWNNITEDGLGEQYVEDAAYTSAVAFSFEDADLITAVTNSPQLGNIKNDFAIWGKRESASGADIPILYRYAIDTKPTHYSTISIPEGTIDKYGEKVPVAPSITYDTTGNNYIPITKNVIYQEYKEIEKPDINDYKVGVYYILEDKPYEKIIYNREEGIVPVSGISFVPTLKGSLKYRAEYYSPYNEKGELLINKITDKNVRFINLDEISRSLAIQNKVYDYDKLQYYSSGETPWIKKVTEPIGEDIWFEEGSLLYDYYYGEENHQLIPVSKFYNFVNSGRFNVFEIEETEAPILKIVTYDTETKEEVLVYETSDNYLEILQQYADYGYDNTTQQNWFFKRQYDTEWTPVKNEKHLTQLLKTKQNYLKFPYSLKLWEKGLKTEGTLIKSNEEYRKAIQEGKRIGRRGITLDDEYYYWNDDKQKFELVDTEEYYRWDDVIYKYGKDFYVKDAQTIVYDWREIIYRMADDYFKYYDRLPDFSERLKKYNPQYITGKTGYEKYYTDIYGFWRQLYNPDLERVEYSGTSTMEFRDEFNPSDDFYYLDETTGKYVLWDDAVNTRSLEVILGNKGKKTPIFMLDNKVLTSPEDVEISAIGVKNDEGKIVPIIFHKTIQNFAAADHSEITIQNPNKEDPEWANKLGLIGSRNTLLENSEFIECKVPDEVEAKETRKVTLNFFTQEDLEKAEKNIATIEKKEGMVQTVQSQGWSKDWKIIEPAKKETGEIIKTDFPSWILIENASAVNPDETIVEKWDSSAYVNTIAKERREFAVTFVGMSPEDERFIYKGDLKGINDLNLGVKENLIWLLGFQVRYNSIQIYYRDSSSSSWIPVKVENAITSVPENQIQSVDSYGYNWNWAYAAISSQALPDSSLSDTEKQLKINSLIDNAATNTNVIIAGTGNDISIETFNRLVTMKRLGFIEIYYKEPIVINNEIVTEDATSSIPASYYTRAYLNPKYEANKNLNKYLRFTNQDEYNKYEGDVYKVSILYDDFNQTYEANEYNYTVMRAFTPVHVNVAIDDIPDWSNLQKNKWVQVVEKNGWKEYDFIETAKDYEKAIEDNNLYLISDADEDQPLLNLTKWTYETETHSEDFIYKMSYQFYPNKDFC